MRPTIFAVLLATACAEDDDPTSTTDPTDDPATTGPAPVNATGESATSGTPPQLVCPDDYQGHEQAGSPLPVEVTRRPVVLGDGTVASPAELGGDRLAVCASTPSDFFVLQAPCPGYLAVALLPVDGSVPDLVLYDEAGLPLEEVLGWWDARFLKPLQRPAGAGDLVLEVRHSGDDAQAYDLTVFMLPDSTCQ